MASLYLQTLGCDNAADVSPENLFLLHERHLEIIPYTNYSIFFNASVPSLDTGSLFDRVIVKKLGGYCFELNGLFAGLLRALGYGVTEYFARWHAGVELEIPMRRHRILKVDCCGRSFLADVGVGCLISSTPLEFVADAVQQKNIRNYRIVKDPLFGNLVQAESQNGYYTLYSFTEDPHHTIDFECVNFYCSQSPESPFRKKLFLHKQGRDFRIFTDNPTPEFPFLSLCEMHGDRVNREPIKSAEQLQRIFSGKFGINDPGLVITDEKLRKSGFVR